MEKKPQSCLACWEVEVLQRMYYLLQKKHADISASFKLQNLPTVQPIISEPWSETADILYGGCPLNRQYQ